MTTTARNAQSIRRSPVSRAVVTAFAPLYSEWDCCCHVGSTVTVSSQCYGVCTMTPHGKAADNCAGYVQLPISQPLNERSQ